MHIREINPDSEVEIGIVAERMRLTLMEVIDEARGASMYTIEWLRARVRFHLDPCQAVGAVFVAEADGGTIVGHTIVRVQQEHDGELGLFSTTYVLPEERRGGVARRLLHRGESWMRERGMQRAATYTSKTNHKLIYLYEGRGYAIDLRSDEMVRLVKTLDGPHHR